LEAISAKEPRIVGLICKKSTIKIKHVMTLRHPAFTFWRSECRVNAQACFWRKYKAKACYDFAPPCIHLLGGVNTFWRSEGT